jgi:hypothetical protein
MLNAGDIIRFGYIYNGCTLNDALAVYLGERHIHRSDGVTVYNFKVLVVGDDTPTICDKNLKRYIRKVEA